MRAPAASSGITTGRRTGGIHIGNRGFGMYGNWLYFETPDNYLVSLNAKDGKERWHVEIADVKQEYFSTPAPIVIRNHVIVGVGGDSLDVPGYLESRDPETGELQWRWYTDAAQRRARRRNLAQSRSHGTRRRHDLDARHLRSRAESLSISAPAIRNPVMAGQGRKGDNLWTCSIVALNPDTGKLAWYFQASPHDTHDWDAVADSRPDRWRIERQAAQDCWRKPAATATSSCWIAPTVKIL